MLAAFTAFIVSLDTKIIIVCTAWIAPVVFTGLHFLGQRSTERRRLHDRRDNIINAFEEKMERFLVSASKLTYKELDANEHDDIIENLKIDAYAKFRAVKRFWKQHERELGVTRAEMCRFENKVHEFLYDSHSKTEWRTCYRRSTQTNLGLLDLSEHLVDIAREE